MSRSKHIIIVVLMLSVFGLNAKAQSTAYAPYEGATHSYTVSGLQEGWDYSFFVSANADGSVVYDDGLTFEFDILDESGTVGADGIATTDISWNNGAAANIYYLWFEVSASNGCSNRRYKEVIPQANQFDLLSENIPVTNTESCPAVASEDGFNHLEGEYAAGYTTLVFKIRRENGTDNPLTAAVGDTYDWSFIPGLVVDPDLGLGNVIISIVGTNSGEITPAAGRYSVSGLDDEVLVTVSIENAPGYDLDVTLGVESQQEDNTNLSDSDSSNDEVTHTIKVMPLIDGMGGV
jgi:hypothetical protein